MAIDRFDDCLRLGILPSYCDKRSFSNVSAVEYESKMLELEARFDKEDIALERLNLIAMESIGGYRIICLSKVFRLALEEGIQGVFEWGQRCWIFTSYTIGKTGVLIKSKMDIFAAANVRLTTHLSTNIKLFTSYERFWEGSVKGFEEETGVFAVYAPPSLEWDIHAESKLEEDKNNTSVGFGVYF
jgi:hypothetical protein